MHNFRPADCHFGRHYGLGVGWRELFVVTGAQQAGDGPCFHGMQNVDCRMQNERTVQAPNRTATDGDVGRGDAPASACMPWPGLSFRAQPRNLAVAGAAQSAIRIPQSAVPLPSCPRRRRQGTIRPVDVSGADAVVEVNHPAVGGGQLRLSKHRVHAARASFKNTGSVARFQL